MELADAARPTPRAATPPLAAASPPSRPRLLVCSWSDEGLDTEAALRGRGWRHDRAEVVHAALPADPAEALVELRAVLREKAASGVLLVELHSREEALVPLGAANRRPRPGPAAGARERRIAPVGPGSARTTAPVADMLRALATQGVVARASAEASEGRGNPLLYRLLTETAAGAGAPAVGALVLSDRAEAAEARTRVLCAAVLAFADVLAPVAALLPA